MNPFDVLGVDETASDADVKKAYFQMVRQFTPEKHADVGDVSPVSCSNAGRPRGARSHGFARASARPTMVSRIGRTSKNRITKTSFYDIEMISRQQLPFVRLPIRLIRGLNGRRRWWP